MAEASIERMPEHFHGEIRVGSRIIDYLSSGLYPSPAACLKELINNSFDADAKRVDILVKPDADRIIIEDDGIGMDRGEFERHFRRVSESHKRDDNDYTVLQRPKIGKIGIGFIAANEICEVMEIFSTKQGSPELLHVSIDFREMRRPPEERKRDGETYIKADYEGKILQTSEESHYTQLFLKEVRGEAKGILAGAEPRSNQDVLSLYGLNAESIERELRNPNLKTWKLFDYYSETMLNVGLNVPVKYSPSWIPQPYRDDLTDFESHVARLNFSVYYDGSELRKPVVFAPDTAGTGVAFVHHFEFSGQHVSARGYFYAQHGSIRPIEVQGLLIRIRNAAVGEYDSSFWDFPSSEYSIIQRWVSAEIWADDRLEDAMNIDRRTLRVAHPAYVELRTAFHRELRIVLAKAQQDIYSAGSRERSTQRTQDAVQQVAKLARETIAPVAPQAARDLTRIWTEVATRPNTKKAILRKYTVAELYEAVVEVAKELLDENLFSEFLKKLTERLGR